MPKNIQKPKRKMCTECPKNSAVRLRLAFYDDFSSLLKPAEASQPAPAASSCQQLPSDPASSLSSCSCFSSSALRCCRRFRSCFDGSPHSFQQKEEIVGIENLRCVLSLAVSFSWPGKLPLMIQMQAIAVASLRWMLAESRAS